MRHMALHDPDSSVLEKAAALKYGRQKKIQVIDGQQVKGSTHLEKLDFSSAIFDLLSSIES